jgi:ABC-type antimicrobial peptide transport system permease subunit
MFVVPSIIAGFAVCYPLLWLQYKYLFTEDLGFQPDLSPEKTAVIQALSIGLLIPILSSIVPIRAALSKSLNDALNPQRSKTQGMMVTVLDTQE